MLLSILVLYYLYNSFQSRLNSIDINELVHRLFASPFIGILILLLVPLNWFIETFKWRRLISTFQVLDIKVAFKVVLTSLSISLITPNRMGDFAGRLIPIEKAFRFEATYVSFVSSLSQLSVTLIVGILFFALNLPSFEFVGFIEEPFLRFFLLIVMSFLLILSFKSTFLIYFFRKFDKAKSLNVSVIESINQFKSRLITLLLSAFRYLIFTSQFVLLSIVFGESFGMELFAAVSIIFLITAIVPTSWISELAVRVGVAFYVFQAMGLDPLVGLSSSICLWGINILLPALVGLIFLNSMNWKLSKSHSV